MSGRARRAVAMMIVAAVAIGAVSIYYLRPWTALQLRLATTSVSATPTPVIDYLTNYYFVSTALGWSVVTATNPITNSQAGPYWLYKTVDAGRHWQRQLSGTTARLFLTLSSLWFADARTGYVVAGDPLVLYRTTDGGAHWTRSRLPVPEVHGLQFVDADDGFATTSVSDLTTVYATRDGGQSWREVPRLPVNEGFWPVFRNAEEAWSGWTDTRPYVYLTVDGGTTWTVSILPDAGDQSGQTNTFVDVQQPGPLVFAYVTVESARDELVYSSVDYGRTWTQVNLPQDPTGVALRGIDATHWWALQDGYALYRTDDGGRSWARAGTTPFNFELARIIDARHAWGVQTSGTSSILWLTADGGASWTATNSPHPA